MSWIFFNIAFILIILGFAIIDADEIKGEIQ